MTEDIGVTKFREYLRVNTEQPNPDYEACKKFLFSLADDLNIQRRAIYTAENVCFVIMTIPGEKPELPSLLLYSHTDVVPTSRDNWKYGPYSAYKDEDGNIYGRGAQDMKCVGSQYFEALRRRFLKGKRQWTRTIHILWAPDEEIGGENGVTKLLLSDQWKTLNVGFVLNEGLANESDVYKVFYAERSAWWIKVTCTGSPGHGSKFIENTASEKIQKFINLALEYRESEKKRMLENGLTLGEVNTVNLTMMEGGVQVNVLPEKLSASFDIRVTPRTSSEEMVRLIEKWCSDAGQGVSYEFLEKMTSEVMTTTSLDDPWFAALDKALKLEKCEYKTEIMAAGTDSYLIRNSGTRSIGFSPMIKTPSLLHDHNEYLNENVFLRGVAIYETLIDKLANVFDGTV